MPRGPEHEPLPPDESLNMPAMDLLGSVMGLRFESVDPEVPQLRQHRNFDLRPSDEAPED